MLARATAAMMPCALLLMMMRLMLLLSSSSSMVGPTCRGVVAAAIDAPVASSSSSAAAKAATIADDPPDPSHRRSHRRGWWLTLPQRPSFGAEGGGGRYRRSAWLDSATGIASSKESSTVPFGATSRRHKRIIGLGGGGAQGAGDGEKDADDDSALLKWVEDWARQYPTWLCSGSVTGGLLRAVFVTGPGGKHASKRQQQQQQQQQQQRVRTGEESVEIRTRIGNWHLLTFGPCQASQRITYRETRKDPDRANRTPKAEEATTTADDDVVLTSHCTVVLPVTGGILALPPQGGGRKDRERRGALLFSVKKKRRVPSAADDTNMIETAQGDGSFRAPDSSSDVRLQLSTALAGYRPALAGKSLPIPAWRKTLYLNTQAVLHGYIMWRFHRFGWSGASNTNEAKSE